MAVKIKDDPVGHWMKHLKPKSQIAARQDLLHFLGWLSQRPGWSGIDPHRLLTRQLEAHGEDGDEYAIVDLVHDYLSSRNVAKNTNRRANANIRGFFRYNRVPLPQEDGWKIPATKPSVVPHLGFPHVLELVKGADLRERSWILVKWMGLLDNEGTVYVGTKLADYVVEQIKRERCPIRLDIPGRKSTENEKNFYTFIGRDAIDALKRYFEQERGWPKKGEPLWLNKYGDPFNLPILSASWMRLCRRIGLVSHKKGDHSTRYGFNPHEMRDIARSHLHLKAKAENFDLDCAEFFMGHTSRLDPMKYDRFYDSEEYMLSQYRIAEKYLNVVSNPPAAALEEQAEKLHDQAKRMAELEAKVQELSTKLLITEAHPAIQAAEADAERAERRLEKARRKP